MSHIVEIDIKIKDAAAVQAACRRLGLPEPVQDTVKFYSGDKITGLTVKLPGWDYPVVCDLQTGKARIDNFGGYWGSETELDKFLQAYAVEKSRIEARRRGHSVTEQNLADGSIKLSIQVAGGAE